MICDQQDYVYNGLSCPYGKDDLIINTKTKFEIFIYESKLISYDFKNVLSVNFDDYSSDIKDFLPSFFGNFYLIVYNNNQTIIFTGGIFVVLKDNYWYIDILFIK